MMTILNLSAISYKLEVSEKMISSEYIKAIPSRQKSMPFGKKFTGEVTEIANSSTTASPFNHRFKASLNASGDQIYQGQTHHESYKSPHQVDEPPFRPWHVRFGRDTNAKTEKCIGISHPICKRLP